MTTARPPRSGETTTITAYPDGPLIVRGPAEVIAEDDTVLERRPGPIALCRCGKSALAPFCDGTHKVLQRGERRRAERRRRTDLE